VNGIKSTVVCAAVAVLAALVQSVLPAFADENPFQDVSPADPAYRAVVRLYHAGYIKGYPDGYFDGKRPLTRYEMAILVDRVTTQLESDLQAPTAAIHVTQENLADARLLLDQYGDQIKDLKAREAALETTTASLGSTLDKAQIHLYSYLRAPGTFDETVDAFTHSGKAIADGTAVTDGVSNYVTGTNARGTGIQVLRLIVSGDLDDQTSYGIRLENKNYFGQANVNGFDNINPSESTYNDQGLLRLNYFFVKYQFTHSPIYAIGGKYMMNEDLGLAYANDYYNGGLLGFNGRLNGFIGFGEQGGPDLGSNSPFAYVPTGLASAGALPHTQFAVNAHLEDKLTSKLSLGTSAIDLQALPQKIYSATTLKFESFNQPLSAGSAALTYAASPYQTFAVEGLERFGDDPTTKKAWEDNRAIWAQYVYGSTAAAANVTNLELGYVGTGYNSVVNNNTGLNGTPFYTSYYTAQANDRHMVYIGLNHFVSANLRVSLDYLTWGLNVPEPIVPNGTTITNGSYMSTNDNRALFLNTQVTL
jgi:hypothetical protein